MCAGSSLPYDDIHDQEVSHQADDADDHVDDHDGGLHSRWQQGVGLVVVAAEVAPIVELQVVDLSQQEVVCVLHLWLGVGVKVGVVGGGLRPPETRLKSC